MNDLIGLYRLEESREASCPLHGDPEWAQEYDAITIDTTGNVWVNKGKVYSAYKVSCWPTGRNWK